jgi:hypothetical protein
MVRWVDGWFWFVGGEEKGKRTWGEGGLVRVKGDLKSSLARNTFCGASQVRHGGKKSGFEGRKVP